MRTFRTSNFRYGSTDYHSHLELVHTKYLREGFTSAEETLVDLHDSDDAAYYKLANSETDMMGTFRIIESKKGPLPSLKVSPNSTLDGIHHKFCESTRVVARRDRDFMGPRLPVTQYVLTEAVVQALCYVKQHELWAVVSLGSPVIFEWINATFGGVQRAFGTPFHYEGGMIVPSIIWGEEFEKKLKEYSSILYNYYEESLQS